MKLAENREIPEKAVEGTASRQAISRRQRDDVEFLPAALEVVETAASPAERTIAATITIVFCLALAWASYGEVDIVASARGQVIPSDRSKTIQPIETGVVRAIHVRDGQHAKAGDVLIELDPTASEADVDQLNSNLISAKLDVAGLHAALASADDALTVFHPPPAASELQVRAQRQFLFEQTAEQRAKIAELDRARTQKEAERDSISANIGKIKTIIPILKQLATIRKIYWSSNGHQKCSILRHR